MSISPVPITPTRSEEFVREDQPAACATASHPVGESIRRSTAKQQVKVDRDGTVDWTDW